jgi:Ca2+-transporting ATPase
MTFEADRAVRQPLLATERQVTVSHIYKLSTEQLRALFGSEDLQDSNLEAQLEALKGHGSARGVLKKLASEASTGIVGDEKDLRRRKAVFGENTKPLPVASSFCESLKQTCSDKLWWVVVGSAILSGICGAVANGAAGLVEGASILVAVVVIVTVVSFADWFKDTRFVALQGSNQEQSAPVIRGKFGATQTVSVWDLVVGDVILLEAGARVPADCLVIESADL